MDLQASCKGEHGNCEPDDCEPTRVLIVFKAYSLGDRFLSPRFRRLVTEGLISRIGYPFWQPMNTLEVVDWAFEHLPADNHLLQMLANDFCFNWRGKGSFHSKGSNLALNKCPVPFMARVMRRYRDLLNDYGLDWELPNQQHCHFEHATEEEKTACVQLHMVYDENEEYGHFA